MRDRIILFFAALGISVGSSACIIHQEIQSLHATIDSLRAAPAPRDTVYMDLGYYEADEVDVPMAEGPTPWKDGRLR